MIKDKLFLLSIKEVIKYLPKIPTRESRICIFEGIKCWWWLRSPGESTSYAVNVGYSGCLDRVGSYVGNSISAVRPALYLNPASLQSLKRNKEGYVMFGNRGWLVLDEEIGLLLAKNAICLHQFDKNNNSYETSEIRKFLNNELYQEMFSEEEQEMIVDTVIDGEASYPVA